MKSLLFLTKLESISSQTYVETLKNQRIKPHKLGVLFRVFNPQVMSNFVFDT
uniref:Uncharacterized protein n=1 Tax=Helianthus annuus TaxID=4232 RepID=A0A251T4I3_HELAN